MGTTTVFLGLYKPDVQEDGWADQVNNNFDVIDEAIENGGLPEQWTDGGNGDVTAEADAGFVPLKIIASDTDTAALELHPAPGGTPLANNLLTFFDDTGAPIGDIDAGGNLFLYQGSSFRMSLHHAGQIIVNAITAELSGSLIFQVKVNGGLSPLQALIPGNGQSVNANALVDGDVALRLGPFDENNDALDIVGGPDYNGGEYRIWGDGKFSTKAHTAPADGDLAAGECAFWFDQTNGAAKLMIKGKSANGTVVTGQVALS